MHRFANGAASHVPLSDVGGSAAPVRTRPPGTPSKPGRGATGRGEAGAPNPDDAVYGAARGGNCVRKRGWDDRVPLSSRGASSPGHGSCGEVTVLRVVDESGAGGDRAMDQTE